MKDDKIEIDRNKEENGKKIESQEEGKPIFYNIWGQKFNRISFVFILIVFLAMISLKTCDSKYVKYVGPDQIKIIGQ